MTGTAILQPISTYNVLSANEGKYVAAFAGSDPQTKSDAVYFKAHAAKFTTPAALLKDYRALGIVLNAFGIGAYVHDTALLKQLMTQNPNASTSTAYKINNPALTRFATAMGQFSPSPFLTKSNVTALLSAGATNNFETQKDSQAPGIANALYFARSIGAIRNMDQLMSDPKLLEVAQIAAKMPKQFGSLDFNTQVRLLSAKVKISDFAKPGFVQQFVTKYLAINAQNNSTVNDTTGALAILTSSGSSDNMLTTLLPSSNSSANPVLSLFSSGGGSSSTSILSLIA